MRMITVFSYTVPGILCEVEANQMPRNFVIDLGNSNKSKKK